MSSAASDAAALKDALTGERTKLKAIVRHMHDKVWRAYGKAEEMDEAKVDQHAHLLRASSALSSTRPDRRFPNMNQINSCWTAVNEYQVCVAKRSATDAMCLQRAKDYSIICPQKWVEDWKSAADSGVALTIGKEFF